MTSKICLTIERREAERGLVEQQQPRPAHQRPGDGQHLLLAARHRAAPLVDPLLEAREQDEHPFEVLVEIGELVDRRAHLQVFVDRHAREDAPALGRLGDRQPGDLVGRQPRDVAPVEGDGSLAGARIAEDGHHQRRFAGAVGADQRDDLTLVHVEIDALQRDDLAVVGLHAADRAGGGVPRSALLGLARVLGRSRSYAELRLDLFDLVVRDAEIGGDDLGSFAHLASGVPSAILVP